MTDRRWAEARDVQREVNALPYRADLARYGVPEFWAQIDAAGGDCEDFALGKRRRLLDLGWPLEALSLATCVDETGSGHAVLLIEGEFAGKPGTWVLDNRRFDVVAWESLPYRWCERQAPGEKRWVNFNGGEDG